MSDPIIPLHHRILVVDDQVAIHDDYRKVFHLGADHSGPMDEAEAAFFGEALTPSTLPVFELDFVFQGEEALGKVEAAVSVGRPYALAFIDMRMPPGWDGLETALRLWAVCPDLQVVICTAHSDYSWEEMLARIGSTDRLVLLKKPFDHLEVLQLAHSLTEKWRLLEEGRAHTAELERRVEERTHELQTTNEKLQAEMARRAVVEEALRQAQKMEAVGQLAGGIAHDFNNLFSVIRGYAGLLAQDKSLSANATAAVREMDEAADRATTLTRQLLTFSRKQVMTPEYLQLNDVLGQTGQLLRRVIREDIALEVEVAENVPEIRGDRAMLEQILLNLAVNARDAMPQGGRLLIRSAAFEFSAADAAQRSGARAGRFAAFSVADTGTGITPEILPRLFEPFFTTRDVGKGTGLGLASTFGIVQQHGGWIEVESTPGLGATFRIFLPACSPPAVEAPRDTPDSPPSGRQETILVVEDETALRTAVRLALQCYGYRVVTATSGVDALTVWQEHAAEIDLLLTDMVMPDGISGPELATRLLSSKPNLKVIYSSGYSKELAMREGLLDDTLHFLPKPYTPVKLASAVRHCLDGKSPASPAAV